MKRKKTTKKKKLAQRVAYNLRFSLIRLNYKAKMQLYEAKQAKRVVTESINRPRTKKIDDSFFGFWLSTYEQFELRGYKHVGMRHACLACRYPYAFV